MLEELVALFKGLEGFDWKPPEKSIVQKVSSAYELLGLPEEKEWILEKYKDLFVDKKTKKISHSHSPKKARPRQRVSWVLMSVVIRLVDGHALSKFGCSL